MLATAMSGLPRATRMKWSGGGLRTALKIAQVWGIDDQGLRRALGSPSRRKWKRWVGLARTNEAFAMPEAMLVRVGIILNLYGALRTLHGEDRDIFAWLMAPHGAAPFLSATPMSMILSGSRFRHEQLLSVLQSKGTGLYMSPVDPEFERGSSDYQLLLE